MRRFLTLSVLCFLGVVSTAAQQVDSVAVPDTTLRDAMPGRAAGIDTTQSGPLLPPIGYDRMDGGTPLTDSLPSRLPVLNLTEILAGTPGSFTYLFATPGWPDGWSPFGMRPQDVSLTFNGIPLVHHFTGLAAYPLVPVSFVEPPRLRAGAFGLPFAVASRLRPFVSTSPITEARYWKGGDGLQSIDVGHAQHRRKSLFGREGFFNVLGTYGGRAADGEYPGSDLRRGRQVQLRLRYEQQDWSLEVLNLHNRRRIGAHGGVIPDPSDPGGIYRPETAIVESSEAERRIVRNDLIAALRMRVLGALPTSIAAYWSSETFRYRVPGDTMTVASDRIGVRIRRPLVRARRHGAEATFDAWRDGFSSPSGVAYAASRRYALHAALRDTFLTSSWHGHLEGGLSVRSHAAGTGVRPTASIIVSKRVGSMWWTGQAALAGRFPDAIDETGFGSLSGRSELDAGRILFGRTAIEVTARAFYIALGAFAHGVSNPVDYFAVGDSLAAVQSGFADVWTAGAYADLGWRRGAGRGLYAVARPVFTRSLSSNREPLNARLAATLPDLYGSARLGARYLLFQNDLDLDMYVEGLFWTAFKSRTLHPESAILIVPEQADPELGASSMINFRVEAGIRGAKIFLVYENALSGTAVMTGNMIVPIYPLPSRRFRIGVHWPIQG